MMRIYISLLCFTLINNANEYDLVSWRDFDYHDEERKSNRPNPANRIHDIKRVCQVNNKQNPSSDRARQLFHDQKKCANWDVTKYWDALVYAYGIYVPEGRLVSNDYKKTDGKRNGCTIYLDKNAFVHVMRQPKLYEYDNFWRLIESFIEYDSLFLEIFNGRINSALRNQTSQKAFYRIKNEYERLNDKMVAQESEQRRLREQSAIQNNFQKSLSAITSELEEWHELQDIADTYDLSNKEHFQKRLDALHEIRKGSINYTNQEYILNDDVVALLVSSKCDPEKYKTNYGNQLQQVLHNECITIASQTARLSPESPVYDYKESLVNLADASRGFNQEGASHKASRLNDLCWSLLDYGSAILEGVAQGAIGAIQDMIDHPWQTAACVVAGEYVLAYQLFKVTTQLADIGITYLQDPQAGKNSWNEYIQPLTTVIDAIANKELTLRDGIKGATALGVGCIAQQKMLKGLGSMYQTARVKAVEFTKHNPLVHPEAYMSTPEGVLLKINNVDDYNIKNRDITTGSLFGKKQKRIKEIIKNTNDFLENFDSQKINVGNKQILLDKKGMKHILQRHHPKYWDGTVKCKQSFFDKNMNIDEVIGAIKEVVNQNRDTIMKTLDQKYQIEGIVAGKKYIIGINNGRIGQFYNLE